MLAETGHSGRGYAPQRRVGGQTLRPKAAPAPAHHYSAPAPAPVQSYSSNSSGQYSGGGGGGGAPHNPAPAHQGHINRPGHGGGHNGNGGHGGNGGGGHPKPPAPAKPAIPSLHKYLAGDSAYQDQLSQLIKQMQDFRTGNLDNRGNVSEDFQTALQKMKNQRGQDLESLQNDYASRGLLNSGLYTNAVGDYNQKYQQNLGDLNTDKQRSLNDLLNAMQQYRQENVTSRQNARQEAIRRRAQKYGIQA